MEMESLKMRLAATSLRATPERGPGRGFTLIEMVAVLAIFSLIMVIAIPSYVESVRKCQRTDATAALRDLANRLERYYSDNNTYATATIASGASTDVLPTAVTREGFYSLSITSQSATTWTIQATRVATGPVANDTRCGDFTLTSTDIRGVTGTQPWSSCW